jgi:hypothetical protein
MLPKLNQSHIVCDSVTYQELNAILNLARLSTITILTDSKLTHLPDQTFQILMNYKTFAPLYSLHQAYLSRRKIKSPTASEIGLNIPHEIYDKILDHCVKLAEVDFYDLDLNI